jgi:hypothetical protein
MIVWRMHKVNNTQDNLLFQNTPFLVYDDMQRLVPIACEAIAPGRLFSCNFQRICLVRETFK